MVNNKQKHLQSIFLVCRYESTHQVCECQLLFAFHTRRDKIGGSERGASLSFNLNSKRVILKVLKDFHVCRGLVAKWKQRQIQVRHSPLCLRCRRNSSKAFFIPRKGWRKCWPLLANKNIFSSKYTRTNIYKVFYCHVIFLHSNLYITIHTHLAHEPSGKLEELRRLKERDMCTSLIRHYTRSVLSR